MSQTADVMRAELTELRAKTHAAMEATGHVPGATSATEAASDEGVQALEAEIARLKASLLQLDKQLAEVRCSLLLACVATKGFDQKHARVGP